LEGQRLKQADTVEAILQAIAVINREANRQPFAQIVLSTENFVRSQANYRELTEEECWDAIDTQITALLRAVIDPGLEETMTYPLEPKRVFWKAQETPVQTTLARMSDELCVGHDTFMDKLGRPVTVQSYVIQATDEEIQTFVSKNAQ